MNMSLYYNCRAINDQLQGAVCFSRSQLFSATQEMPVILRNPTVHYRVYKSPPVAPVRSNQSTPSRAIFRSLFYFILPSTYGSPNWRLSGFAANILCVFVVCTIHSTFPAHLFLLGFIIRIIIGYEHKLEAPVCNFLQCYRPSSRLVPTKFLSASPWLLNVAIICRRGGGFMIAKLMFSFTF
jgi:hypothetical protein